MPIRSRRRWPRPKLESSLLGLLAHSAVVVLGYGGWDDALTRAMARIANNPGVAPELLWTFREERGPDIWSSRQDLFARMPELLGRARLSLYRGIDLHAFLPRLRDALERAPTTPAPRVDPPDTPPIGTPPARSPFVAGPPRADPPRVLTGTSGTAAPGGGIDPNRRPWTVPHHRNQHFRPRPQLGKLSKALAAAPSGLPQPQVLHGTAGVGKTQLAVEFAWMSRADYQAVLWVVADSPAALAANVANQATALGLPAIGREVEEARLAVVTWLRDRTHWLLVLDNVDSNAAASAVREFVSPCPRRGRTATSRSDCNRREAAGH